ncbi:MFS transporter [Corynebacterium hansenii]|uniref:MFS transporter n=1 Tax=Corynebacterium hansenii TaxID=394964 RepID=A0ABV7ZN35_9CORY|nr:MFS transporter [Corynebacterium hansenii]WJZ00572.1 multidrug efflux system protein MdtL [Corynebacterium hansenii]
MNDAVARRTTDGHAPTGLVFATVAALLLSSGWAANHFASVLVVLRDQQNYSPVLVNAAFGIYALGLVPCLLFGGALADRVGARPVVLVGGVVAALGNLALLLWHGAAGLMIGRFIVGLGVGLAMSAGTAWAGKLRGASGVTLAGIMLTSGFATGPIASGLLAFALPESATIAVPFIVTVVFSLAAVAASAAIGDARHEPVRLSPATAEDGAANEGVASDGAAGVAKQPGPGHDHPRGMGIALMTSLPMALWVFACVTTAFLVLAGRVSAHFESGVLLPGVAAVFAFGSGLTAQALGRKHGFGPKSGIAGALFAAAGMTLAGLGAQTPPVWLFIAASMALGTAYGLCLREGLLDIETFSPPEHRGTAIGIYYVFTYLGFGLPVLLEALLHIAGPTIPLLVLAAVAVGSALVRSVQLRAGVFAGR